VSRPLSRPAALALSIGLLLLGVIVTVRWLPNNHQPLPAPLVEFPARLQGGWHAVEDLTLPPGQLTMLQLNDYLIRNYDPGVDADAAADLRTPAQLYVAYYDADRGEYLVHSPENCFPSAGWKFVRFGPRVVTLPGTGPVTVIEGLVAKGLDRQVVMYFFYDRGRVLSSALVAKLLLLRDAALHGRTDGSLVRLSVPVVANEALAERRLTQFLADLWPSLQARIPGI